MINNWESVKLGEILNESKITSSNPNPDKRIRVRLNVRGVEKRPANEDIEGATKYYIRKSNQFIYGKQNLFKGAFGIIPKELDGFESSLDIPAFDVASNCLPHWIFYFFKQNNFYKGLESLSIGAASKRIHPDKLFEVKIPLPDINIQRSILNKISLLENKQKILQKEIISQKTYISNLRQSILQEAIQGNLVHQNPNDEPVTHLVEKIEKEKNKLISLKKSNAKYYTNKFENLIPRIKLPDSWKWVTIGSICDLKTGATPSTNNNEYFGGNIKWLVSGDIHKRFIYDCDGRITPLGMRNSNCKILPINSVLIALNGQGKTRGTVAILKTEAACNQSLVALVPYLDNEILTNYIFYSLKSIYYNIREITGQKKRRGLNMKLVSQLPIPLPPLSEQNRIVYKVEQLMNLCDELEENIKQSEKDADMLMQAILKEAFENKE